MARRCSMRSPGDRGRSAGTRQLWPEARAAREWERLGAIDAGAAVRLLSDTTGTTYEVVRRLAGGETGAHLIRRRGGQERVMKWEFDPASQAARRTAVELTERLRTEASWPVPHQSMVESD